MLTKWLYDFCSTDTTFVVMWIWSPCSLRAGNVNEMSSIISPSGAVMKAKTCAFIHICTTHHCLVQFFPTTLSSFSTLLVQKPPWCIIWAIQHHNQSTHAGRRQLWSADIDTCCVPPTNTRFGDRSFAADGPRLWNSLPARIRQPDNDTGEFRRQLKSFLFKWHRCAKRLSDFMRLLNALTRCSFRT